MFDGVQGVNWESPEDARRRIAATQARLRREVEAMLVELERMAHEAMELAQSACHGPLPGALRRFHSLRDRIEEFRGLALAVEDRLDRLGASSPQEQRERLDQLDFYMMYLFVRGAGWFFDRFARQKYFPLGAHELCHEELRGILGMRAVLEGPGFAGERGDALRVEADRTLGTIQTIIAQSLALPVFG